MIDIHVLSDAFAESHGEAIKSNEIVAPLLEVVSLLEEDSQDSQSESCEIVTMLHGDLANARQERIASWRGKVRPRNDGHAVQCEVIGLESDDADDDCEVILVQERFKENVTDTAASPSCPRLAIASPMGKRPCVPYDTAPPPLKRQKCQFF